MLIYDDSITRVHRLTGGPIKTNTYIVESAGKSFLIDPVGEAAKIISYLHENNLSPLFLIATHAHFDHIAGAKELLDAKLGECLYIFDQDLPELQKAKMMSLLIAKQAFLTPAYRPINDETKNNLKNLNFEIQHLPGHTTGSIVIYRKDKKILFSGDLIVNNLVANEKPNPGENPQEMHRSIEMLQTMFAGDTLLFPGHGTLTKLETELKFNKMIQFARKCCE